MKRGKERADTGEAAGASLHLMKLCVGCASPEELRRWIDRRLAERRSAGQPVEQIHVTRMMPQRREALLAGGSLYWVIRGNVQVRQRLLDLQAFRDEGGIDRCRIVLEPELVHTAWQPRRAFQGWRYLKAGEAPADLTDGAEGLAELPPKLRRELASLGLL